MFLLRFSPLNSDETKVENFSVNPKMILSSMAFKINNANESKIK